MDLDERDQLTEHLGDMLVMIMKNHGLLTIGSTVAQAFVRMLYLERSCQGLMLAPQGENCICFQKKFTSAYQTVRTKCISGSVRMGCIANKAESIRPILQELNLQK